MRLTALSEQVIGCAFEVSNRLGAGFLEAVYENALCHELTYKGVPFVRQKPLEVRYRGKIVGNYVADIVVGNRLLLELKALSKLSPEHDAQVMNYLNASGLKVGLLLNFGTPKLGIRRIVWEYNECERI
ncbi:MAG: GxxExxY protein [Gammaproteobacteria bacterium]|nr:GxxExxY protein [Gammaproteobacteria bacterium]